MVKRRQSEVGEKIIRVRMSRRRKRKDRQKREGRLDTSKVGREVTLAGEVFEEREDNQGRE